MPDRILKPDAGSDLVLQNNGGTAKIEINDGQEINVSIGSSSGDDFNVGSGKLLVEGDTSLVSITGDFKVGGNDIQDSGGNSCFTFDGSGNTNMADKILQRPEVKDYSESVNAIGNTSASQAIDLTLGNVITATLAVATTTFTFTNPSPTGKSCSFTLKLSQDGSGSRAVTWPGAVYWAGGTTPTISTGANDCDFFTFISVDAGTIWYGFVAGLDLS